MCVSVCECGGRGGEGSVMVYYAGPYVGLYVWRCVCVSGEGEERSLIVYYAGRYVGLYVWRCVCVCGGEGGKAHSVLCRAVCRFVRLEVCLCVWGGGGKAHSVLCRAVCRFVRLEVCLCV